MIVKFSDNIIKQFTGIIYWNLRPILFFLFCSVLAYLLCCYWGYTYLILPPIPISILGGALAIFLAFKNSSAYDRWWEARKIWGGIVNDSRSIGLEFNTYGIAKEGEQDELEIWKERVVHRHIGWVYALRSHLRKEEHCKELSKWITQQEQLKLRDVSNVPTQMLLLQGKDIAYAFKKEWIEEFRFNALML